MPKPNWSGGASGAIQGGSTGATIGGPVGGVIGAVTGGVAGLFGGGKKKKKKRSTLDKRQQQINESQFQGLNGEGDFADLYNYDPEAANDVFNKTFANPAYRKFQEDLAPKLTGQFRSQGLQNSSYVGESLSKLARDIQEGLDAKRSETLYNEKKDANSAKRNAIENYQNRQTFAYDTAAPSSGGIDDFFKNLSPETVKQIGDYFNKPGAA